MKRLEDQYKRTIRHWVVLAVIVQGFAAILWVYSQRALASVPLIQNSDWLRGCLALVSIPLPSGLAFLMIERYRSKGWRKRNREVDFCGEWRFDAEIVFATQDPMFANGSTEALDSKAVVGTKLFGLLYIDQTTGSIAIRRARTYEQGSRKCYGVWKSTSCRLAESGDEVRLSYVVHRLHGHQTNHWFGDRGTMQLDVIQSEQLTDSRPLKLAGTFHDSIGTGRIPCMGTITLSRCLSSPGTATEKKFFEAESDPLLVTPQQNTHVDATDGLSLRSALAKMTRRRPLRVEHGATEVDTREMVGRKSSESTKGSAARSNGSSDSRNTVDVSSRS